MPTIKDVARLAHVSVATVSRTINKEPIVSPETRDAVQRAIDQLGYVPNHLGRDLRCAKTRRILVLLPTISNQFYSKVIRGMEDEAALHDYVLMLCVFHSQKKTEDRYLDLLKSRLVDGAVFLSSCQTEKEMNQLAKQFPVVQCCEYLENSNTSIVKLDEEEAAVTAIEHLLSLGHQKIAMIGSELPYLSAQKRLSGYRQAMKKHGLASLEQIVKAQDYSFEAGVKSAKALLSASDRPTAVFAVSDALAAGVISAAFQMGMKLPKELSVMGFDDAAIAKMYSPSISTMAQPRYELGQTAIRLLLNRISHPEREPETAVFSAQLIKRQSTSEQM